VRQKTKPPPDSVRLRIEHALISAGVRKLELSGRLGVRASKLSRIIRKDPESPELLWWCLRIAVALGVSPQTIHPDLRE
jgi:hypothetical protein